MSTITKIIGLRIRAYRLHAGLTQEELAELAELHGTYIGQVERGEKNLTVTSLEKILNALKIPFSRFFEAMDLNNDAPSIASQCYDIINEKSLHQQENLLQILSEIELLIRHSES